MKWLEWLNWQWANLDNHAETYPFVIFLLSLGLLMRLILWDWDLIFCSYAMYHQHYLVACCQNLYTASNILQCTPDLYMKVRCKKGRLYYYFCSANQMCRLIINEQLYGRLKIFRCWLERICQYLVVAPILVSVFDFGEFTAAVVMHSRFVSLTHLYQCLVCYLS
jgi:hypothetical protein